MRKYAAIGVVATLALGLTACGSSSKTAGNTTTTKPACSTTSDAYSHTVGKASDFKPVVADTLSVVTSLPGPGFWEGSDTDPTKLTSGYEYDIAKELQKQFGLSKLSVRNIGFDAIVAGSVTKYDLALSQISIRCDRAKVATFSMPYFESQQGVLTRTADSITTLAQAKKAKWGVETVTTAIDLLKKIGVDNPHSYQSLADAYTALDAGQIDAVLIDTAINLGEAARSKGKFHVTSQFDQTTGPDEYGAFLPKGSANIGAVNAAFKDMKDSGKFSSLTAKDLTADPGTLPVIKIPS